MMPISPRANDVLIVVDIQNDFCDGGALAVAGADEIIAPVNKLALCFDNIVLTQDWHPPKHSSFASAHPGRNALDTISCDYGSQLLWPDHCIQQTYGAAVHSDIDIPHAAAVIRKGINPKIDSYSAFYENDRRTPTGLLGYVKERGFRRIFFAGLALDFCVRYSAEDVCREGFPTFVIVDCCRAINLKGSLEKTRDSFSALGVNCIDSVSLTYIPHS